MAANPTSATAAAQAVTAPRANIFTKPAPPPRPASPGLHGVFDPSSACAPAEVREPSAAAAYRRRRRTAPALTWAALLAGLIALIAAWAQLRDTTPDRAASPASQHHQRSGAGESARDAVDRRRVPAQRMTRKRAKAHRATRPRRSTRRRPVPPPPPVPANSGPSAPPHRVTPRRPPMPGQLPTRVAPDAPPEFM